MFNNDYYKWTTGSTFQYAASLAATWIWAPALLISSKQAYENGLPGALMFLVPNILTMAIFAYFINIIRNKYNIEGYTYADAFYNVDKKQEHLHVFMSCILLILSTCVQIVGIHTALSYLINNKFINCTIVSLFSLAIVWKNGLKASIITDTYKYIILLICAIIVLSCSSGEIVCTGISGKTATEVFWEFGLVCGLGLLSAPYVDSTMWQRGFSIPKDKVVKTFVYASLLFGIIPGIFCIVGFMGAHTYSGTLQTIMLLATLCALISTLDSNLVAIAGFANKNFGISDIKSRLLMATVLAIACFIFITDLFNITTLFLSYNAIRTCIVLPTIFIILKIYSVKRIYPLTFIACLICPIGYMLTNHWIFVVLALLITIFSLDPILLCKKIKQQ